MAVSRNCLDENGNANALPSQSKASAVQSRLVAGTDRQYTVLDTLGVVEVGIHRLAAQMESIVRAALSSAEPAGNPTITSTCLSGFHI